MNPIKYEDATKFAAVSSFGGWALCGRGKSRCGMMLYSKNDAELVAFAVSSLYRQKTHIKKETPSLWLVWSEWTI